MIWDESKHPRDKIGRFTYLAKAKEIYAPDPNILPRSMLPESYRLPDERLPRSVGAKWKNYDVMDLDTGNIYHFVEGSWIRNVEVFCGSGTKTPYRKAYLYANKIGGDPDEWQHVKGFGLLDTEEGHRMAEIHWSQHKKFGRFDLFVKRWLY